MIDLTGDFEITSETPKAIRVKTRAGNDWYPKSQTRIKEGRFFVADWIFNQNNLGVLFPKATKECVPTSENGPGVKQEPLTSGVYEHEGKVYVVKKNREGTHFYASEIQEIGGTRVTDDGQYVNIEFVYAPGIVSQLKASEKMNIGRGKELAIRYGRCIKCGRFLKDAESVEAGIGPTCRKSFSF
jgi:hypothetical protein